MLNGSLDTFGLSDVLSFVASSGVTGRIEITREEVGGELSIDRGRFVAARLTDEEAPSTVDETLDVAVLLFDGNGGEFVVVPEEWVGGPLDLDAGALTKAVERRREEWAEVVSVLGSLEDPLILAGDLPKGTQQVTISAEQWRMLILIDGTRSVQDVARDSGQSVYAGARALAELFNRGLVARGAGWKSEDTEPERPAKKGRKGAPEAEEAAAELHELAADESDEDDGDGDAEEVADVVQPARATVRPLRAPTREEQRIRLRR